MKGITPVIAIILLLLITISMVGFAFVWFTRVQTDIQTDIGSAADRQIENMNKLISINLAQGSTLYIRNTGLRAITDADLSIYINGIYTVCNPPIGTVAAGTTGMCTLGTPCVAGQTARVVAPGNTDETVCT